MKREFLTRLCAASRFRMSKKINQLRRCGDAFSNYGSDEIQKNRKEDMEERRHQRELEEFHRKHTDNNQKPNYQRLIDYEDHKFENGEKPPKLEKYFKAMFEKE